jgi:hypothetical protein
MEWEVGAAQQVVNGSSKRLEGESEKRWNLMWSAVLSFICAASDSMMIRFPREKIHFCFNHLRNPDVESRSQRVGDLKYFEVHSV